MDFVGIVVGIIVSGLLTLLFKGLIWRSKKKSSNKPANTNIRLQDWLRDKEVLYESTVLLNPGFWTGISHPKPYQLAVTETTLYIGATPPVIIPFDSIEDIQFKRWWSADLQSPLVGTIKIITRMKTYRLAWGPESKWAPYSIDETEDLYKSLVWLYENEGIENQARVVVQIPYVSEQKDSAVFQIEDELIDHVEGAGLGEYDGNEIGDGEMRIYFYSQDPHKLVDFVENTLRASKIRIPDYKVSITSPGEKPSQKQGNLLE